MIIYKLHENNEGKKILSLCDKELLGKEFEDGNGFLNLKSDFYNGTEFNIEKSDIIISKSNSINAVGNESIKLLLNKNITNDSHIKKIKKIPYAIIVFE